ncbi:MAG: LytTR family DNA-binding domain-containing protein [Eubacteriales bacterium]|nr:LytTR family DNA-binding domain-containing protein [Eubacteriales bacterium]
MNWIEELIIREKTQDILFPFLQKYGFGGLEKALKEYDLAQQLYICKTKLSTHRLRIDDIYYLDIRGHNIRIHTADQVYVKYGTLSDELKTLSSYGFLRCSRNCAVAVNKIKTIQQSQIVLSNNQQLYMSQKYSWQILSWMMLASKK